MRLLPLVVLLFLAHGARGAPAYEVYTDATVLVGEIPLFTVPFGYCNDTGVVPIPAGFNVSMSASGTSSNPYAQALWMCGSAVFAAVDCAKEWAVQSVSWAGAARAGETCLFQICSNVGGPADVSVTRFTLILIGGPAPAE